MARRKNPHKHSHKIPLRNHFTRDGKPKRGFQTYTSAVDFARTNNKPGGYEVYQCDFCNMFHLASNGKFGVK